MTLALVIYVILCIVTYNNNRQKIGPVHVFQINYFIGVIIRLAYGILAVYLQETFVKTGLLGKNCFHHYFGMFTFINGSCDIIIMQVDRLVAIDRPFFHYSQVTTRRAFGICLITKLFSATVLTVAIFMDPSFGRCQQCARCYYASSTNFYTESLTKLVAVFLTSAVSIYVAFKVFNPDNLESEEKAIQHKENKQTLTMNLMTLIQWILVIPEAVLNILHWNCDTAKGECADYLRESNPITLIRLIMVLIHPFIVLAKIKKIHLIPRK